MALLMREIMGGLLCEECNGRIDGEAPGYARICRECFEELNQDITRTFHELKCLPEFFEAVKSGVKKFEIRYNDRGYMVGEGIRLKEYSPVVRKYTGRDLLVEITYKTDFEQKEGFVVLGIEPIIIKEPGREMP